MSDTNNWDSEDSDSESRGNFDPQDFQEFLKKFLANPESFDAKEFVRMAGLPDNPEQLAAFVNGLQAAIANGGSLTDGVNWKIALDQAKQIARQENRAILESQRDSLSQAGAIGALWLNAVTGISELTLEPKLLTRDLWVDDAMPLVRSLSEPIANRMSSALSEHLQRNAPEELGEALAGAGGLMKSAGGALFAMQLGGAVGKLSTQVISGADLGLPIFIEQRAAFVPQNLADFVLGLGLDQQEALIYLSVRELAHARLFKHSRWLRDHVVAQITNFASEIAIDDSKLIELAEQQELNDPDQIRELLESGALIADRTDDQERAIESIETMLALIEGWVQTITDEATKLLPKQAAISEAVRRRRATGGPTEIMFGTLVGLQLRPRLLREAAELWRLVGQELGPEVRDSLWSHPDRLPTADDIANPPALLARLRGNHPGDDQIDRALRDLLGDN